MRKHREEMRREGHSSSGQRKGEGEGESPGVGMGLLEGEQGGARVKKGWRTAIVKEPTSSANQRGTLAMQHEEK